MSWNAFNQFFVDDSGSDTVPSAPTGLTATKQACALAIDLSWSAPSDGGCSITGYKIERKIGSGSYSTIVADTGNTNTSYSNTGLSEGTQYTYKVSAINSIGTGTASNEDDDTTNTSPGAPTNLDVTTVSTTETQITWTAPASNGGCSISGYKIERENPVGGGFSTIVSDTGSTSTTYNNTGLTAGTQYNYRISAINGIGTGAASTADFGYTLDSDVSTFISAQSIVNTQEINALNIAIIQLKGLNSISKNFYTQASYINLISPTSLAVSKAAIKFPTSQNATAIGTDGTHSNDGVLFNGTSQGWDLNNAVNTIPQSNLLMCYSRSNTVTVNGVPFGANDVTNSNSAQFYPRPVATSGFLTGTSHGLLSGPGIYVGSNDGTNTMIHRDGVLITPSANTARPTGTPTTKDIFIGCRNNNGTANAFVDERITSIMVINMGGTPYTSAQIAVLSEIIQTYNETVV